MMNFYILCEDSFGLFLCLALAGRADHANDSIPHLFYAQAYIDWDYVEHFGCLLLYRFLSGAGPD